MTMQNECDPSTFLDHVDANLGHSDHDDFFPWQKDVSEMGEERQVRGVEISPPPNCHGYRKQKTEKKI